MKFENAQHLSMEQFEKICDLKFSQAAYSKSPIISDQRNEIKPAVICHVYTYMCAMSPCVAATCQSSYVFNQRTFAAGKE